VDKKRELIMQAIGQASMCWEQAPDSVFDSEEAIAVGEKLYSDLFTGPGGNHNTQAARETDVCHCKCHEENKTDSK